MSRLYASIDSDARKTQATSRGYSHIDAHIRGWDSGVRVTADADGEQDTFTIYATHGSNGGPSDQALGRVYKGTDGELYFEGTGALAPIMLAC